VRGLNAAGSRGEEDWRRRKVNGCLTDGWGTTVKIH
jgi:hypothetical protein